MGWVLKVLLLLLISLSLLNAFSPIHGLQYGAKISVLGRIEHRQYNVTSYMYSHIYIHYLMRSVFYGTK